MKGLTATERANKAIAASRVGLWANIALAAFKYTAGILGNSSAMIADAANSLSDAFTDIIAMASFRISKRPIDYNHDYGHGKFETLASLVVGAFVLVVAILILWSGGSRIASAMHGRALPRPGPIALGAAIVTLLSKESLYRYTTRKAKELSSNTLVAKAWDHRSDALISLCTFAGIGGAMFLGERWRILDPIAAIAVSFFIAKVAISILIMSLHELMEGSLPRETEEEIEKVIAQVPKVVNYHKLRTRKIGKDYAVDVHVVVSRDCSIVEAHDISEDLEEKLRDKFGRDTHITIHIEPSLEGPKADGSDGAGGEGQNPQV